MVGSGWSEISRRVQWHKPALLRDRRIEQRRKSVIVIRWSCVEGPSLNG